MPLTRGQILGYDNERLAFAFTMMNYGEIVPSRSVTQRWTVSQGQRVR